MQNNAIESRTQMRLNTEVQEQQQRLADFKLTKEQARLELREYMTVMMIMVTIMMMINDDSRYSHAI